MSTTMNLEAAKHLSMAGSAAVACVACRRLKMRCLGLESGGACNRCAKAKRECVVVPSRRGYQQNKSSARHDTGGRSSKGRSQQNGLASQQHGPEKAASALLVSEDASSRLNRAPDINGHSPSQSTRSSSTPAGFLSTLNSPQSTSTIIRPRRDHAASSIEDPGRSRLPAGLSETALEDLVHFFLQRLVYFVPILDSSDFDDLPFVLKYRRPLAYCAAYVAANYAPGAGHLRDQLSLPVHEFLRSLEGPLDRDEDTIWMQLQAYAILYAYCASTDISNPVVESEHTRRLNHWVLKASLETFALRLSLHHAFSEVRALVQADAQDIWQSYSFRKYVYWLWLFTLSHHFSLVTESPPSIRPDYSIRIACSLLSQVDKPARITRMLAEVDLCMLWNAAGKSLPGLDEWWCPPPQDQDPEAASTVLDDADAALDVWSQRWGVHGEPNATYPGLDVNNNGAVLFHYRSTRFWLRAFSIRIIRSSRLTSTSAFSLGQLSVKLTLKSAEAAERMCRYLLDIPLVKRDSAKHMADFGFALVAFCGMFILRIYELFGSAFPILATYIKTVEDMGHLLTEMSIGSNQMPLVYGKRVLERLEQVMSTHAQVVDPSLGRASAEEMNVDLRWIDDFFARV